MLKQRYYQPLGKGYQLFLETLKSSSPKDVLIRVSTPVKQHFVALTPFLLYETSKTTVRTSVPATNCTVPLSRISSLPGLIKYSRY
jgi:hypothetical protein